MLQTRLLYVQGNVEEKRGRIKTKAKNGRPREERATRKEQPSETKTTERNTGPCRGQRSGQLWQHRSLFPAPPLLPRSQCKGVLLNHTHSLPLP